MNRFVAIIWLKTFCEVDQLLFQSSPQARMYNARLQVLTLPKLNFHNLEQKHEKYINKRLHKLQLCGPVTVDDFSGVLSQGSFWTNLVKKTSTEVFVPKFPQVRQAFGKYIREFFHEQYCLQRSVILWAPNYKKTQTIRYRKCYIFANTLRTNHYLWTKANTGNQLVKQMISQANDRSSPLENFRSLHMWRTHAWNWSIFR